MKRRSTLARAPASPGIQAVSRALAILKAFAGAHTVWGLSELATELGLNKTTAFRLLGALEREGMVARDADGERYRLGPELIALGAQALRASDLRTLAHDQLASLARESGETATLEILVGDEVLILDEVQGRFILGSVPEIGTRWPAHATSTGKVLLAAARERGRPLPDPLARRTARTITSAVRLARELATVTEQGYAVCVDELERGFTALGAPVRNHDGEVIAAISIGAPSARLTASRIPDCALLVRRTADAVARRLGASPDMLRRPGVSRAAPRAAQGTHGSRAGQ